MKTELNKFLGTEKIEKKGKNIILYFKNSKEIGNQFYANLKQIFNYSYTVKEGNILSLYDASEKEYDIENFIKSDKFSISEFSDKFINAYIENLSENSAVLNFSFETLNFSLLKQLSEFFNTENIEVISFAISTGLFAESEKSFKVRIFF